MAPASADSADSADSAGASVSAESTEASISVESGAASASAPSPARNKRLIVCCDGTWNDSISTDSPLTNVSRISRCIPRQSDTGLVQVVSYWSGVGSGTAKFGNIVDGMTGRGKSANIRDAYAFICHNYVQNESSSDEIILIGFSRGAFTVRSIAFFINDVGLLEKGGLSYMVRLYKLWSNQLSMKRDKDDMFPGMPPSTPQIRLRRLCQRLREMDLLRIGVRIKVCAVWDTVGSLGFPMPGPIPQGVSQKLAFVDSTLSENIENAFQALALNERRKHFQPTVWKSNSKTNLRQCWFLGSHSDVGGGNADTGLANLALVWMMAQLNEFVYFDPGALLRLSSDERIGDIEKVTTKLKEFSFSQDSVRVINTSSSLHRVAGDIKDSLKGPFLVGGTKSRKPAQYLMNNHGLYRIRQESPASTNEKVHWTVRVLLGSGFAQCPPLEKFSTSRDSAGIIWTSDSGKQNEHTTRLQEEEFGDLERELLLQWLRAVESQRMSFIHRQMTELQIEAENDLSQRQTHGMHQFLIDPTQRNLSGVLLPLLDEPRNPTIEVPFRHSQNCQQTTTKPITRDSVRPRMELR